MTWKIVGEDEADVKARMISVNSPIARAMIGMSGADLRNLCNEAALVATQSIRAQLPAGLLLLMPRAEHLRYTLSKFHLNQAAGQLAVPTGATQLPVSNSLLQLLSPEHGMYSKVACE